MIKVFFSVKKVPSISTATALKGIVVMCITFPIPLCYYVSAFVSSFLAKNEISFTGNHIFHFMQEVLF